MSQYRYFREKVDQNPLEYRVGMRPGDPVQLRTEAGWRKSAFEDVDDLLDPSHRWPLGFEEVDSL